MTTEQKVGSVTSLLPPPSRYLTIDGLLRRHASDDGERPMFGYPVKTASDYEVHTVGTIDRYIDAACWWYLARGLQSAVRSHTPLVITHSEE